MSETEQIHIKLPTDFESYDIARKTGFLGMKQLRSLCAPLKADIFLIPYQ